PTKDRESRRRGQLVPKSSKSLKTAMQVDVFNRPTGDEPSPPPEREPVVRVPIALANTRTSRPRSYVFVAIVLLVGCTPAWPARAAEDRPHRAYDWGRAPTAAEGVAPPYRARWIWCGPDRILRNKASNPAWPDDLSLGDRPGVNYPMPARVPLTFAGRAQSVV